MKEFDVQHMVMINNFSTSLQFPYELALVHMKDPFLLEITL